MVFFAATGQILSRDGQNGAVDAAMILPRPDVFEGAVYYQMLNSRLLIVADFEHGQPVRRKSLAHKRQDRAIGVETIGAAIQRRKGVMEPDFRVEGGDSGRGNVRGIGDDQVERFVRE